VGEVGVKKEAFLVLSATLLLPLLLLLLQALLTVGCKLGNKARAGAVRGTATVKNNNKKNLLIDLICEILIGIRDNETSKIIAQRTLALSRASSMLPHTSIRKEEIDRQ
jgi:hypothetical protein